MTLPPGQHAIEGFPRFGTHLDRRAPRVPGDPAIEISGAVTVIEPSLRPGAAVTHVVFGGLDRYRSVATIEDALADDVLIAERLDGRPLDADHGAPVRLVSPGQYGFVSTKHLSRIELLTSRPSESYRSATTSAALGLRLLGFGRPTRARVWEEERGGFLPNRLARPVYRLLVPPIRFLCGRGSRGA